MIFSSVLDRAEQSGVSGSNLIWENNPCAKHENPWRAEKEVYCTRDDLCQSGLGAREISRPRSLPPLSDGHYWCPSGLGGVTVGRMSKPRLPADFVRQIAYRYDEFFPGLPLAFWNDPLFKPYRGDPTIRLSRPIKPVQLFGLH